MIDLTPVVNAIIALVTALVMAFLIPWIKQNTNQQNRDEMLKWIDIAVSAAQQLYHDLNGSERKEYVQQYLISKGYDVSSKDVDNAIEAAVLKLHHELEDKK